MQLGPAGWGFLEQDRVGREALRERLQDVAGRERLAGARRVGRGRALIRRSPAGALLDRLRQRLADRRRGAEDRERGGAAVRLVRVLRDHRQARPRVHERAGVVRVLAQRARADDEDRVVGAQHLAQALPPGGRVAGEQRMVLREPRGAAEGLLEDRAVEPLGEGGERRPARFGVVARAGDDRRRPGVAEDRLQCRDGPRVGGVRAQQAQWAERSCGSPAAALQSSIGTITSAGPRAVVAAW